MKRRKRAAPRPLPVEERTWTAVARAVLELRRRVAELEGLVAELTLRVE